MTTSINGLPLPMKTETYVATQFPDSVQGVSHRVEFIFLGSSGNNPHPDFTQLVGMHDFTTGQDVGNQEDSAPANSVSFGQTAVFDNITVDYSHSTAAISVDLASNPQHGGFAEGDTLTNVFAIIGTSFNDVIRGRNLTAALDQVFNDPGENSLFGGAGDDVLEGRSGPDLLNGGSGNDIASYESSPAAVTVRLAGVGSDTQTAIATGGDAQGDTLVGIEGLVGSQHDDILTGNSLDNVLAGGLSNDTLDGKGGNDTVDYSRDHFFDRISVFSTDTADKVVVALGLGSADGTGIEFKAHLTQGLPGGGGGVTFDQVSVDTLKNIENVTGTAGTDTITGNEQNNILDGREGNDTLDGGFGNDTLIGGAGNDTASFLSHDSGTVPLGEQNVIALGLNGADGVFNRSEFSRTGLQTAETDVLRGIENVTGSNRSETINGNEQVNVLDGRGGNDTLDGGLGNDTLIGNDGIDTVSYASHNAVNLLGDTIVITLGSGTSDGSATAVIVGAGFSLTGETDILRSIENVTGSSHVDIITGNDQPNVLDGRDGNDVLIGGGLDTLIGGRGDDTYHSNDDSNILVEQPNEGHDTVVTTAALLTLAANIEDLYYTGTDDFIGVGNAGDNFIHGDLGDDYLIGLDGNDTLYGAGGFANTLQGGKGDDTYIVENSNDSLVEFANEGHDTVLTTLTHATLLTNFEDLRYSGASDFTGIGNDAANFIQGNAGNDHLTGLGGNDELDGGANNDVYDYSGSFDSAFGNDRISDDSGSDAIAVNNFSDVQTQRSGDDLVLALPGGTIRVADHFAGHAVESIIDTSGNSMVLATGLIGGSTPGIITGTNGNDLLDGKGGDDFLFGGDGNDRLIGGDGNDRLTGGNGNDSFVFGPGSGHDVVTDFSPAAGHTVFEVLGLFVLPWLERVGIGHDFVEGDQIEFDGSVFHDFRQVLAASHQVGNDTVIAIGANDSITLQGVALHSLHAGDFLFV